MTHTECYKPHKGKKVLQDTQPDHSCTGNTEDEVNAMIHSAKWKQWYTGRCVYSTTYVEWVHYYTGWRYYSGACDEVVTREVKTERIGHKVFTGRSEDSDSQDEVRIWFTERSEDIDSQDEVRILIHRTRWGHWFTGRSEDIDSQDEVRTLIHRTKWGYWFTGRCEDSDSQDEVRTVIHRTRWGQWFTGRSEDSELQDEVKTVIHGTKWRQWFTVIQSENSATHNRKSRQCTQIEDSVTLNDIDIRATCNTHPKQSYARHTVTTVL